MKIIVDCKVLSLYSSGIYSYFIPMLKGLLAAMPQHEFVFVSPVPFSIPTLENKKYKITNAVVPTHDLKKGFLTDSFYALVTFPHSLTRLSGDLLISPYFDFIIPRYYTGRSIFIIHDLCQLELPRLYGWKQRLLYSYLIRNNCSRSSAVVTVSEFSKTRIQKRFSSAIGSEKLCLIYNSIGEHWLETPSINFSSTEIDKLLLNDHKYVLYTGGVEARKNINRLVQLIQFSGKKWKNIGFICTGSSWQTSGMQERFSSDISGPHVVFPGHLSDQALMYLYTNRCSWAINLSLYEGFGRPCLEAQHAGIPLLCSDIPSFREIGGDYPIYCNPHDINDIIAKFEQLIVQQQRKLIAAIDNRFDEDLNVIKFTGLCKNVINQIKCNGRS